jgi:hypothetical protein
MKNKLIILSLLAGLAFAAASGCKEKTPAQKAADGIDKAYQNTKEAVKDGAEAVKDGAEKVADKTKEAVK